MTDHTIKALLNTRVRILQQVESGELQVKEAAQLLGMTRQGLWKLRNNAKKYGTRKALLGRKRGPLPGSRTWNRTPKHIEDKVEELWSNTEVGIDRLSWYLEDQGIVLSRATVYRILIRRRLIAVKQKGPRKEPKLYAKGYPGEEVQIDTTEPFGKGKGILISAIDDYSRWADAALYYGNTSMHASLFVKEYLRRAPFPVKAVRVDGGSEFQGSFKKACLQLGIKRIQNPPYSPQKNGKVERLHRTIEEECLWRVKTGIEEGNYWLNRYLAWYNNTRRHGGFGMSRRTPRGQIEKWIIDNTFNHPFFQDVNETLILYT